MPARMDFAADSDPTGRLTATTVSQPQPPRACNPLKTWDNLAMAQPHVNPPGTGHEGTKPSRTGPVPGARAEFAWPPRPRASADEPSSSAAHARSASAEPRSGSGPRWLSALMTSARGVAREIEHHWLDPVSLPLHRTMHERGWSADVLGTWCDCCGGSVGPSEADEFGCAACRNSRPPWARVVRLGDYAPPLSDWICEVKFNRSQRLGIDLGHLLGQSLQNCGVLDASTHARGIAVVPMPTTLRRRWQRGIDHTHLIATGVARRLGAPLAQALRREHRVPQRALPPSNRARNVAKAFRGTRGGEKYEGMLLVLVDDVITTGATMRAACRALREACKPKEIWAATLAVTPDPARRALAPEGNAAAAIESAHR